MIDNVHPAAEIPPERESGVSRVLVRTGDKGNRHQLVTWFAEQESYEVVQTDMRTGEFDCCILDWTTLLDSQNAIRTRKQADRIPFPVVLFVPEHQADERIRALQTDTRDLHSLVDELLRMPVSPLELEHRLDSVLRARHQAIRLNKEHEQLELLNRVLRHDICNDMQVIMGWIEALESHVDSDREAILDQVLNSGQHVVELTDTAKTIVEAIIGEEDIALEPVNLDATLEHVIETRQETFDQARITMADQPPAGTVKANEMLAAVFRNLINNAIQHNDTDEPKVSITTQEDENSVRILIADNGPGIPERQRNQLFESDKKGLESEGTGMGLYLVANLVEMYDGSVRIEDNDPRGAVFVVELPTIGSSSGDNSG